MENKKFSLTESFIEKYKNKKTSFGFNGLGELVYLRTYSRMKLDGKNELWYETVKRVVEGTFNMQKRWIEEYSLGWNNKKAQSSAQEMYDRIFHMKFLPPGRGLYAMGSSITEERKLYAALNNCSFISTTNIKEDLSKPFCFLMDVSMLGVGCGFDTLGVNQINIKGDKKDKTILYKISDDREGWVESVRLLLDSYFLNSPKVEFDYSLIRKEGEAIKGFGGISSGPKPLEDCHKSIRNVLDKNIGEGITVISIVDIMNLIGKCIVSGNVRRTAEIIFGDYNSNEYLDLKNKKVNPERNNDTDGWGWTSNNSIFADVGMDYHNSTERTKNNGEPGYFWLENAKNYSRMNNGPDKKDVRACGANPCNEQTLESYELCTLVETFPNNHESLDDFLKTLKYAYLYAKTVTLGKTHWSESNRVMLRNRRIGCSMSGIAQFITKHGIHKLKEWCEVGYSEIERYDNEYSDWLAIPKSIKKTSVKPSGSVSLLTGSTPGIHYPESRFYIRRLRLGKNSELIKPLQKSGYNIEPCKGSEETTIVVEIPVDIGEGVRTLDDVSMWEQLNLAAFMQKYWADNQVSCTVTFNEREGNDIKNALNYFQYQLKGISFLPRKEQKPYKQMVYEAITEEKYKEMMKNLKPLNIRQLSNEVAEVEKFCNNDICEIK